MPPPDNLYTGRADSTGWRALINLLDVEPGARSANLVAVPREWGWTIGSGRAAGLSDRRCWAARAEATESL